jgi:isopentenyldiphosphate isomerase
MSDELIDICDAKNNLLGIQKMKSEAHKTGLWHRSAHVWIYNSKKEILLQLRAKSKNLFPNVWDIAVAGHVSKNEQPIDAAIRETREEIGLTIKKDDLKFFKTIKESTVYKNIKNNEIDHVYLLKIDDISKISVQKKEVQKIKFFPLKQLINQLQTKPEKFLSAHGKYWTIVINKINQQN